MNRADKSAVKTHAANGRPGKTRNSAAIELPSRFYGSPLPGVKPEELSGTLVVIEGTDGSGRSTQISLLTEWLGSVSLPKQNLGLRRFSLVGEDIDGVLAENSVTRMTLALMYSTDFFDQLERRILPALRSGLIVL